MEEKIFLQKNPGSHPKEKFGLEVMDLTPKRNLVWKQRIPPRREIWSGSDGSHPEEKSGKRALDPTPKEI